MTNETTYYTFVSLFVQRLRSTFSVFERYSHNQSFSVRNPSPTREFTHTHWQNVHPENFKVIKLRSVYVNRRNFPVHWKVGHKRQDKRNCAFCRAWKLQFKRELVLVQCVQKYFKFTFDPPHYKMNSFTSQSVQISLIVKFPGRQVYCNGRGYSNHYRGW